MDVVLGVSLAPTAVRMTLVEGEYADGVTVEEDDFAVPADSSAADRVVAAILGTREGAAEGGYQLTSTGVTCTDQTDAVMLRDMLADHKIENVMLVSAFLAAAALTQQVGGAVGYAHTALIFCDPDTVTSAVVDTADGAIGAVFRRSRYGEAAEVLADTMAGLHQLDTRPGGVFLVGSGVDVGPIKARLEALTPLPVSVPEEPETALARGAALASAHAPLFTSSTQALAYAQDPGTGVVDPDALALSYAYVADGGYGGNLLAYSAEPDESADGYRAAGGDGGRRSRRPLLLAGSAAATVVVIGVVALVVSLALDIRPTARLLPNPGGSLVAPAEPAPPPAPTIQQPAPVVQQLQPAVAPPAHVPAAPAPVPVPAAAVPALPIPVVPPPAPPVAEAPMPAPVPLPIPVPVVLPRMPTLMLPKAPPPPIQAPKPTMKPPVWQPPTWQPPKPTVKPPVQVPEPPVQVPEPPVQVPEPPVWQPPKWQPPKPPVQAPEPPVWQPPKWQPPKPPVQAPKPPVWQPPKWQPPQWQPKAPAAPKLPVFQPPKAPLFPKLPFPKLRLPF